jgi:hypothetical protein
MREKRKVRNSQGAEVGINDRGSPWQTFKIAIELQAIRRERISGYSLVHEPCDDHGASGWISWFIAKVNYK